eukprot:sb/3475651/
MFWVPTSGGVNGPPVLGSEMGRVESDEEIKRALPCPPLTSTMNSLFRSRDWLSANQGTVFPDSISITYQVVSGSPRHANTDNPLFLPSNFSRISWSDLAGSGVAPLLNNCHRVQPKTYLGGGRG